eukprot:4610462-Pyramimonas_sp.AAC.1
MRRRRRRSTFRRTSLACALGERPCSRPSARLGVSVVTVCFTASPNVVCASPFPSDKSKSDGEPSTPIQ